MKKFVFSLSALMMLFMMASCGSGASKIESLAKDVEKNSDDWDTEKWVEVLKEAYQTGIEFYESEPKEKDFDKFEDAFEELDDAISSSDSHNKFEKAIGKKEVKKLKDKFRKARDKAKKKIDKDDD